MIFEFTSIWWTFPALAVSVLLMFRYGPRAFNTLSLIFRGEWKEVTPSLWINLGIAICFFGSIVDNGYWFIAWTSKYGAFDHKQLFANGVYWNVPFRQLPLILGSVLHVFAEGVSHNDLNKRKARLKQLSRVFGYSTLIGFAFAVLMTVIRFLRLGHL